MKSIELKNVLPNSLTSPSPGITFHPTCHDQPSGLGVVIFPGGGYGHLAPHEGAGYAEFLSRNGIAGFVVEYRLGTSGFHHPAMLEDALAAIREIRVRSDEFGVDPAKIGVMGSSAGGHLAAHSMVAAEEYEDGTSSRPDFGILCYPVIQSKGPFAHEGSMRNLLGDSYDDAARLSSMSLDERVSADTPPAFIWHTVEDAAVPVENSISFASALRRENIPFELHLYEKGGHGLGLNAEFDWGADLLRWLRRFDQGD